MHAKRDGADMDLLLFQVKAEDQKKDVFHLRITTLRWEMVGEVTKPTLHLLNLSSTCIMK